MLLWIKIGLPIGLLTLFAILGLLIMGEPLAAGGMALLGIATIIFTQRSLAPLEDVTRVIESVAAGDLHHESIEERQRRDEIGRLARSTNQMISRLNRISEEAEKLAGGDIGVVEVEQQVMESGQLSDADIELKRSDGDLERSFTRLTNQMRRLTIQARVIARDDLNSPLLDDRVPGDLGDAFALMVRNLRTIAERAKDIADGDLTTYVDGDGDLTTAFNQMVTSLNDLVRRIVQTALHISSASEEILIVLQDQELAASHQASGVEETQRTMETLLESAKRIADNSQTVFKSAEKTQANNRTVADRIGELKSHTARIAEILEVIQSIADRSDLLALNASLEGMRAGEAGKGFTLVAAEMRRLAENIKESVGDIKELVSDIRESSLATVMATEQGSNLSEQTTDTALQISLITQQQQSGTEQVTQSMEELSHLINQGVAGTRQVTTAASDLANAADTLQNLVNKFDVVNAPNADGSSSSIPSFQAPQTGDSSSSKNPSSASKTRDTNARNNSPDQIADLRSTLTQSRQFAMRARQATPAHLSEDNLDIDSDTESDDPDTAPVGEPDRDLDTPTVQFSSTHSDRDELFDEIASLSRTSPSENSGEFEAIAREIESTEIQADLDEEDSEST